MTQLADPPPPAPPPPNATAAPPPVVAALQERLADPETAAALAGVLDHADVLALALASLDGLLRRAEVIGESVETGLSDLRVLGDQVAFLAGPTSRLAADAPAIADAAEALLDSGMLRAEVVTLLGTFAGALVQGTERARTNQTTINGLLPALRALRDPEVGRGLGVLLEISRAIGRTV